MRHHADLPAVDPPDASPDGRASRRLRVGVGAAVVLLIAAAVVAVLISATAQRGTSVGIPTGFGRSFSSSAPPSGVPVPSGSPRGSILVHVTGAVRKPGLVSLGPGARVVDAVAAAGGMADDADPAAINLARPVADGEQLVVRRVGESPEGGAGVTGAEGSGAAPVAGPVNLNTARAAELETLPRIGPALAQRILDWRQANGRFAQASDLLKVSGIGQKLFDGIKDRLVV